MPASRVSRRRRSSLAISYNPAKAGIYGAPSRPVTFVTNVTPGTYAEPDLDDDSFSTSEASSPTSKLFPPSSTPAPPPTRRRVPPGKRRSLGYIPRPPNAFMLFRADFVRQKHVPGSIETNHGSLSKIIGNCWRSLPLDEKRVWDIKAKHAKAEHKARYPEYRFRPVHNKNKTKKEKPFVTPEDERRCEDVANLLLDGKKGDELAAAVRQLDALRTDAMTPPPYRRRSSSVPLPSDYSYHGIALPSLPFMSSQSRPGSPVGSISRQQRMMLGHRRSSSARPANVTRSWTAPTPSALQRDDSPLPEVDTSLFEQSFLDAASSNFFPTHDSNGNAYSMNDLLFQGQSNDQQHMNLGPLDPISPHDVLSASSPSHLEMDPNSSWSSIDPSLHFDAYRSDSQPPSSHPSTAYSGSPAPSDNSLPPPPQTVMPMTPTFLHAPQPLHHAEMNLNSETIFTDLWKNLSTSNSFSMSDSTVHNLSMNFESGLEFDGHAGQEMDHCSPSGQEEPHMHDYAAGLTDYLDEHSQQYQQSPYAEDHSPNSTAELEYGFEDMLQAATLE